MAAVIYVRPASWPYPIWVWLSAWLSLLLLPQPLHADQLLLQRHTAGFTVGADSNQVFVGIVNDSDRQGLQFDLVYDPAFLRPVQVLGLGRLGETEYLHYLVGPPGVVRILAYDRSGTAWAIPPGSDPVVAVTFDVLATPAIGSVHLAAVHGLSAVDAGTPVILPATTLDVRVAAAEWVRSLETVTGEALPGRFALYQNTPNPFEGSTVIRFDIPDASPTRIVVFDVAGRPVRLLADRTFAPGRYAITWDDASGRVPARPGIYFCVMESGHFRQVRKLIRVK